MTARLLARLRDLGVEFPDGTTVVITKYRPHAYAEGAWRWFLLTPDDRPLDIGSQFTVTDCARALDRLTVSRDRFAQTHIDIEPEK